MTPCMALEGFVELKLGHYSKDGIEVVDVEGEIDIYTAPRLRELLMDLVSQGSYELVVNLDKVGFFDSTGLGVLVGGLRRVAGSGLHAGADPEDLPDHRADEGLRHLRDGGPGHRGHEGPPVRKVSPGAKQPRDSGPPAGGAGAPPRLGGKRGG